MRSMCKWVFAAILSCAAFVCPAEDPVEFDGGDFLMYWMVTGQNGSDMSAKVAEKGDYFASAGLSGTAADFDYAKLVAVIDGEKTVVGFSQLTDLEAPPQIADVGGLSGSAPVTSFWVEYYNYNSETEALTLLGWSDSVTPESLAGMGALKDFRDLHTHVTPSGSDYWSPTSFTAVPEPTSGLLLLIGGALLALRRKQKKGAC